MSTNQKYIFCALSLLVSSQAVSMRQVTSRTGTQLGRAALGAGAVFAVEDDVAHAPRVAVRRALDALRRNRVSFLPHRLFYIILVHPLSPCV